MKIETPAIRTINANLAAECSKKSPDRGRVDCLRRTLREEQLAEHIRRVLSADPALTADQRTRLAAMLAPRAA